MPFLLAAWPLIRRFGPYAAAIAAFLLGWHMLAVHYRTEGRAEMQATANAYKQQRDSWITAFHQSDANFHVAMFAVNVMNADARKLADAYDKSKAQDAANVAASNKRWEQTQRTLSDLRDVIAADGGCKVDERNLKALDRLSGGGNGI